MKTFSFLIVYFFVTLLSIPVIAQQWNTMHIAGLPNSTNSTLIFSPVDADIVWGIQSTDAGIVNPKFILTTNGGNNWSLADVLIPSGHNVQSIHAINATTAYIAVDDPAGSNSGIYKTTNSGTSWVKQDSAFLGSGRHPRHVYFFDVVHGLCIGNPPDSGYWEIYTTSNGGTNWTRVPQSNIPNVGDDITFTTTSAASGFSFWFGTCGRDLFRTADRGLTWAVTQNAFAEPPDFCGVDIAFKNPGNGIAVTYFGDLINRVYKTTDGGITWSNLPTPPGEPSFKFLNHVSGDIYIATSHATVGQTVTPGSAFTSDDGNTWHVIDDLIHGPVWSKNGFSWSGGINDMVYKIQTEALPFSEFWTTQYANGLPNSVNPQLDFSAVDDNIFWGISIENSNYVRTIDGGTTWTVDTIPGATGLSGSSISALDAYIAYIAMNDPSNATSGGVFKTTDGGLTWTKQTTAFPGSGGYPAHIQFFDSNVGVVVGQPKSGSYEIYTTSNGGSQWTQVVNVPAPSSDEITTGYASVGNNIWFGTVGGSPNNFSIYKSTDRGHTWQRFPQSGKVTLALAFKDALNGLAVNCFESNEVFKTTDGGVTWTAQNGPTNHSAMFISYAKGTPGSYVITSRTNIGYPVQTTPGSSYSNNDGATWIPIDNLPHGEAEFSSGDIGWSGGLNDIIYKWDSNVLTGIEHDFTAIMRFKLLQNYPNPFNPSTVIGYQLPVTGFVSLKVYDVLGNEVATLVNEEKPAGSYEVDFSARGLSSGIYFYSLQAGSFIQTKKLILIK